MGPLLLEQGDVILLPHGTSHDLVDAPDGRAVSWASLGPTLVGSGTYHLSAGGGGARALVVCCTIAFEGPTAHPLVEMLPLVMHIKQSEGEGHSRVATLLELMADEVEQQRIGAATIMARLADIVLTRVVRAWAEAPTTDERGWLAAVKDRQIGLALATIHRSPGDAWTIERLAAAASLSRSSFSKRFGELLGISPGQYLLTWRMRLATTWLRRDDLSLSQIADRLGYESYASFSRAYRRSTGHAPSTSRTRTD